MSIEVSFLAPTLKTLLAGMHAKLGAGTGSDCRRRCAPTSISTSTVARRLLGETAAAPVAGGERLGVAAWSRPRRRPRGISPVSLFGETRYVDFTQFTPRGHYAEHATLETYFRAMIWLGRTDLRFLQYDTSRAPAARRALRPPAVPVRPAARELTDADGPATTWRRQDRRRCGGSWASPTT